MGRVITTARELRQALPEAEVDHFGIYRERQAAMFAERVDLTDEPSSVRAARAIANLAGLPTDGVAPLPTPEPQTVGEK